MKIIKKAAAVVMALCLLSPCISMVAHAAAAQLQFSDPSTTVGAEVEVKVRLASAASIKTLEASLQYDKEMLRFVSGDSATGGNGTISISGTGTGTELVLMMTFQALQEGSGKIEVGSASGTTSTGEALEITNGTSTVTIGPGDPSLIQPEEDGQAAAAPTDGAPTTVDGMDYVISGEFSEAIMPVGFSKTEMTYEGASVPVIQQDSSGETAMYLVPAAGGEGDFFLYNADKGTFSPFEAVDISQDRYIVLLKDTGSVKLPKAYQETTLTLNGKEFPVWQDTNNSDYYVVYALNSDGQKMLYQFDNVDQTYQRYVKAKAADTQEAATPKGLFGKITQLLKDNLTMFLIAGAVIFLLFLILLIVIAVKLHHRNLELDDLYDEYGIDEEEEQPKAKKNERQMSKKDKAMKPAVRKPEEELFDEEDFEDDGADLMDDDFDDDFATLDEDDFDDDSYADDFYEEDAEDHDGDIEDLDEMLSSKSKKKRGHMEEDDAFKVDFIDLD